MVKIDTKLVHYEIVEKDKKGNSSIKIVFLGGYNENPFSITSFVIANKENLEKADALKQSEEIIKVELDEKNVVQAYNRKSGEYVYNADGSPVYNGKLDAIKIREIGFETYSQLESSLMQLEKLRNKKKK